jgi:ferredoxin
VHFVYLRRRNPPSRLSKGPWMRLPKSLLAFSASFFLVTLPVAGILPADFGGWLLAAMLGVGVLWGVSELFFGMTWGGPMKHAFAGALHLAWHRRAERFGGGRSTGLKPLDLNDRTRRWAWKTQGFHLEPVARFRRLRAVRQVRSGVPGVRRRPAAEPEKADSGHGHRPGRWHRCHLRRQPVSGQTHRRARGNPHQPIVNGLVDAETLWSCTTCRACVEECPMMIEHVDAIVDMRRHLTLEKGATPNKGAEVLENLIATDNPGGFAPGGRMNWAADLNLPLLSDKGRRRAVLGRRRRLRHAQPAHPARVRQSAESGQGRLRRARPGRTRQRRRGATPGR